MRWISSLDDAVEGRADPRGGWWKAGAATEARYADMGRLARESVSGAFETAGAVRALGRLRELLEQELRASAVATPDPHDDSTVTAVVAACERLMAAVVDDAATSRPESQERTGATEVPPPEDALAVKENGETTTEGPPAPASQAP